MCKLAYMQIFYYCDLDFSVSLFDLFFFFFVSASANDCLE